MDGDLVSESAVERSTTSKAMIRIVPLLFAAYLTAQVDRGNVSFAAAQMNADLGFDAATYGLGAGIFFLGYAIFEVPSSAFLVRVGPRRWLGFLLVVWGTLAAGMMFIRTPVEFYLVRFLIGVAEAGFFPGAIYYLAQWFPMRSRGRAISRMYVASPLAFAVVGVISGPMLRLRGFEGLSGWQWLFLLQGLPAVTFGMVLWLLLPTGPHKANWLTTKERTWLLTELSRESTPARPPAKGDWLRIMTTPSVVLFGLVGLLGNAGSSGLILFAPTMFAAQGFASRQVGMIVALAGLTGVMSMLAAGWKSDRYGDRLRDTIRCAAVCGAAFAGIAAIRSPTVLVVGFVLLAAASTAISVLVAAAFADLMSGRNLALGGALINTLAQLGAFASPYIWGLVKDATGTYTDVFLASSLIFACQALLVAHIRRDIVGRHMG